MSGLQCIGWTLFWFSAIMLTIYGCVGVYTAVWWLRHRHRRRKMREEER